MENYSRFFYDAYIANIGAPPVLREARAILAQWSNAEIPLKDGELLSGSTHTNEAVSFHYGDGISINYAAAEALGLDLEPIHAAKYHNPYSPHFGKYCGDIFTDEEMRSIEAGAATSTWFGGHLAMDYDRALTIGLDGYRDLIKASDNGSDYYIALHTILDAFQALIERTAISCENAGMHENAAILRNIAHNPPATFREALQLVLMLHIGANADSFGRFDCYLYPFYARDIQSGSLTKEFALKLLESMVVKVEEFEQIQNMTIGGVLPDGSCAYTELTELVMEAVRNMGYKGPNLCLRVNKCMPEHFWGLINQNLSTGQGLPALYNDEKVFDFLSKDGYPIEDVRNYCLGGCSQIMFGGKCQFVNDIGIFNAARIFELTLQRGGYTSYDELEQAYLQDIDYYAKLEADINNKDIQHRGQKEGYAYRSLFTQGCIESGKGVFEGGALYNNVQLECIGITNAADSLYAVKRAVFEDKRATMEELQQALAADYEGHETLRAYLQNLPKFGNDHEVVDIIRTRITTRIYDSLRAQAGVFGGHYIPGEVIFIAHEYCGAVVGATPDGRKSAQVLADSAGSSQGMDKKGPTALINSLLKIDVSEIVTSVVLNLKFNKAFFAQHGDLATALFKAYFAQGGQQLQINVCDNDILQKAIDNPEQYQNLVVRVGGYSDYFVRLSPKLQQEIIKRSECVM